MLTDFKSLLMNTFDIASLLQVPSVDLERLEYVISTISNNKDTPFHDIAEYFFSSTGKRIRALLTISISRIFFGSDIPLPECVFYAAAAIEIIHNSTLLHDDVIDNTKIRRNRKSVNNIWDNKVSILFGDFLIVQSLQTLLKCENLSIISILANTSMMITIGEMEQMNAISRIKDIDIGKYLHIIELKTATLFASACSIGAIIVDANEEYIKKSEEFGKSLGIGFQIMDDLIDYTSDVSGKSIGNDFFEKKITLPIILLYSKSDQYEKLFLENAMDISVDNSSMLSDVLCIMKKYDVFNEVREIASKYLLNSKEIFSILLSRNKDNTKDIICNDVIDRNNKFFEFLLDRDC